MLGKSGAGAVGMPGESGRYATRTGEEYTARTKRAGEDMIEESGRYDWGNVVGMLREKW